MNLNQITLPALDIQVSATFYRRMGFTQIVDSPHYARFECPQGDTTFSLHRVDTLSTPHGVVVYFETEELDEQVAELKSKGYLFTREPENQRWLWREARLLDPSGNEICLFFAGENRKNPPWRVNLNGD